MKYNCTIIDTNDDFNEVTIEIKNIFITGFSNSGISARVGNEVEVNIQLYDDLEISESNINKNTIIRKDNTFSYSIYGILDVDNCLLKSVINFEIDKECLFDYGYLDGKMVKVDVIRIDIDLP